MFSDRWPAIGNAAILALSLLAPAAAAQDFSFQESIPVLEACLAESPTPAAREACIGQGARDCEARYGWSSFTQAACLSGEADFWQDRLGRLAYPAGSGSLAADAFAAWQAFVQAECALAQQRHGEGTGQSAAGAECRMELHGSRNAALVTVASGKTGAPGSAAADNASPAAAAPGWCGNAPLNPTEQAICATPALWAFDARLTQAYRALFGPGPLTEAQRVWLGKRNGCGGDVACIGEAYRVRIAAMAADRPARGTVLDLTDGDRACYVLLERPDGSQASFPGDFDLCTARGTIGRTVALAWTEARVMAASCEGDMDCPDTDSIWLIERLMPVD